MKQIVVVCAVVLAGLSFCVSEEQYSPGKIAVYDYPAKNPSEQAGKQTAVQMPHNAYNLESPDISMVRKVSLEKKNNRYVWRIEFIPWLEGENTIPEIALKDEKIPSFTVNASINKKALFVPPLKTMEMHEGLHIRLLIYFILLILGFALGILVLIKRKVIITTIKLYIALVYEQYKLIQAVSQLKENNWKALDFSARRYCDRISNALHRHHAFKNVMGYIPALNLTAEEIAMQEHIPQVFKAKIVELLTSIERARWENKPEDFLQCSALAKELPVVLSTILSKDAQA